MPYVKLGLAALKVAAAAGRLAGFPIPNVAGLLESQLGYTCMCLHTCIRVCVYAYLHVHACNVAGLLESQLGALVELKYEAVGR